MKRIALVLAPLALASAAFAQATLPEVADTDGNGSWSLVELQAVWTDLTEDNFKAIDTSADGKIWTLTLRDGLKFHDGTPVLARDCVASVQRWGKRDSGSSDGGNTTVGVDGRRDHDGDGDGDGGGDGGGGD